MITPDPERLRELITDRYELPDPVISRFSDDHPVFRVIAGDRHAVIRIGRGLERYAAVLAALGRAGVPGPRVIPDRSGRLITPLDELELLIMDYVAGEPTPFSPVPLGRLAATLGRLHRAGEAATTVAGEPPPGLPRIDRAVMLPANELRFGLSRLEPVADRVEAADRALWQRLVDACYAGRSFGSDPNDGLTRVFLHGDAHPRNSVLTPAGSVALIDWDAAGPGPAVIDLAFLALSCARGFISEPPVPFDPARLAAVAAGYREQVRLTEADLDALPEAMAFRLLVAAAVGFGGRVAAGRRPLDHPGFRWTLERIDQVPWLAARLREQLA
ncbi:phosphotransferase [Microlunatus speluncae]|uniref:phosphotransferase n=1 Tax=Microlunatus speluncae TaxID=2594267 RepID=UPI001375B9B6|nr:phosphotransferase [Microlunatus speluncae]